MKWHRSGTDMRRSAPHPTASRRHWKRRVGLMSRRGMFSCGKMTGVSPTSISASATSSSSAARFRWASEGIRLASAASTEGRCATRDSQRFPRKASRRWSKRSGRTALLPGLSASTHTDRFLEPAGEQPEQRCRNSMPPMRRGRRRRTEPRRNSHTASSDALRYRRSPCHPPARYTRFVEPRLLRVVLARKVRGQCVDLPNRRADRSADMRPWRERRPNVATRF